MSEDQQSRPQAIADLLYPLCKHVVFQRFVRGDVVSRRGGLIEHGYYDFSPLLSIFRVRMEKQGAIYRSFPASSSPAFMTFTSMISSLAGSLPVVRKSNSRLERWGNISVNSDAMKVRAN